MLAGALSFVDTSIGRFVTELKARGLGGDTAIIISAKHGQSPTVPAQAVRAEHTEVLLPQLG